MRERGVTDSPMNGGINLPIQDLKGAESEYFMGVNSPMKGGLLVSFFFAMIDLAISVKIDMFFC